MTNEELGGKICELVRLLRTIQHGPGALVSGETFEQAQRRATEQLGKVAREILAEQVRDFMGTPVDYLPIVTVGQEAGP